MQNIATLVRLPTDYCRYRKRISTAVVPTVQVEEGGGEFAGTDRDENGITVQCPSHRASWSEGKAPIRR
jgi:hypothetical protein